MGWKLLDVLPKAQQDQLRDHTRIDCPTGKAPYFTRDAAERRLSTILDMGSVHDMHTYRCEYCRKFHIGHRRGVR